MSGGRRPRAPDAVLPPGSFGPAGPVWSEAEARALLDHLETAGWRALAEAGVRGRIDALGRAGARLGDPSDALRREAEARLPGEAGLSPEGARAVVAGMAREWTSERLEAAVRADFPRPRVLDGFVEAPRGERLRAVPPRLLVQVGAGNVPGTGATALFRALLVGAPTLLKPGRGDRTLSLTAARAIGEEAPELAAGVAVVAWEGGRGDALEDRALRRARRIVVYGGAEAVTAVRTRASPLAPVVAYGPRVSAGIVLREALAGAEGLRVAEAAARAVSAYEQRGCVSPHAIWVESGGERSPGEWAALLGESLDAVARDLPPPSPDPSVGAAMRQILDAAELSAAAGGEVRVRGGPGRGWMVVEEADPAFRPSCLGRTVRVLPLPDIGRLPELLEPARGLLQTLAVEGPEARRLAVAEAAASAGVTRVTSFHAQPWPPAWWRHDGRGPLEALVAWATVEPPESR